MPDAVPDLLHYLRQSRQAVLRGLDGLSEFDARRPLMPSGSTVLGLVKHLTGVEMEYLGDCVGRPVARELPWIADGSIDDGADMWATPEQSREELVALYRRAWAHAEATVAALPFDAPAHVHWWPPARQATTLGHLLVRVVAETAQHAGQIDVLRESVDGHHHADLRDEEHRRSYVARIQESAEAFR